MTHTERTQLNAEYMRGFDRYVEPAPVCQLESDCGQPMHAGGQGGCKFHETEMWLAELSGESDPNRRIDIITTLVELDWVAQ